MKELFNMIAQSGVLEYLTSQLQGLLAKFDELKASGELDQWAKSVANGFVQVANTAQGVFAALQAIAPAFESLLKSWAVSKVMAFAGSLDLQARRSQRRGRGDGEGHAQIQSICCSVPSFAGGDCGVGAESGEAGSRSPGTMAPTRPS